MEVKSLRAWTPMTSALQQCNSLSLQISTSKSSSEDPEELISPSSLDSVKLESLEVGQFVEFIGWNHSSAKMPNYRS
jgi:hypothetical protein